MNDLLFLIVILAISAISAWLKKKGEAEEESQVPGQPPQRPRQQPPPPPPQRRSLEDELRRFLEGQLPGETPTAPPPLVRREEKPPAAPKLPQPAQAPSIKIYSDLAYKPEAKPARVSVAVTPAAPAAVPTVPLRAIDHSRHHRSADAKAAIALVKNPKTVRHAVIASIILGPPKALEG